METRDQVEGIYEKVMDSLYLSNDRMNVNGEQYQPQTLFSTLSAVVNGNQMMKGDPGKGKTTSAEAVSSIMFGLPLEAVQIAEIHGHPEQTEDKYKATLNLAKLEQEGVEEVLWKLPVFMNHKIVDEQNRLPPGKQNTMLNELDRNIWSYRGETVYSPDGPFYATVNKKDVGNVDMHPPLRDRFDVSVVVDYPGAFESRFIRDGSVSGKREALKDLETTQEIIDTVEEYETDPAEAVGAIHEITEEFKPELADRLGLEQGIPTIEGLEQARSEIHELEIDTDANLFMDYALSELEYCGRGDKEECEYNCHYAGDYPGHDLEDLGGRFAESVVTYSKALAWFDGSDEVTIEHLTSVFPHAMAHRSEFYSQAEDDYREDQRESPLDFYIAEEVTERMRKNWSKDGVKREQKKALKKIMDKEYDSEIEAEGEMANHPVIRSYRKSHAAESFLHMAGEFGYDLSDVEVDDPSYDEVVDAPEPPEDTEDEPVDVSGQEYTEE